MKNVDFVKYGRLTLLLEAESINQFSDRVFHVFEKVDGGNCQIRKLEDGRLMAGSRANFLTGKPVISRVPWFSKILKWMYTNHSLFGLPTDKVMFGEWSGNHTISYSPDNVDSFFLIDMFDLKRGMFMNYDDAKELVTNCGIKGVRTLKTLVRGNINAEQLKKMLLEEESEYYQGHKEGLVIKAYSDPQMFLKLHHPQFAELRRLKDGSIDYLTPSRFRKTYYRMLEESGDTTIDGLTRAVLADVKSEGGNYNLDEIIKRFDEYRALDELKL